MKGSAGIPALHLETLNKLIDRTPSPLNLMFTGLFPSANYPSDEIKWDIMYGSGGMTPFVAPGSQAPVVGMDGIGSGSAKAAFYKEKTYLDESMLNNLRQPGTTQTYLTAEKLLSVQLRKLKSRIARRREWMLAKMLLEGSLSYQLSNGTKFAVSYGVPTQNLITLTGNNVWGTGTTRNPVRDMFDMKLMLSDNYGNTPDLVVINSATLRLMMFDANIQDLLKKSTFGDGDLMSRPGPVLSHLFGIGNFTIYDGMFEIRAYLMGAVTGGSTVSIPVDDASDFEINAKLRFVDARTPLKYEERLITGVDKLNNTVTIASAPTASYSTQYGYVVARKKFVADNVVSMLTTNSDTGPIAEFMQAPYGNDRRWGMFADSWDEKDPEGTWMRVQDKGLPVLYYPECIASLTVA